MNIYISNNKDEVLIKFQYSVERISKIKTFPESRWDNYSKSWIIKFSEDNLKKLKTMFPNDKVFFNLVDDFGIERTREELKLKGYSNKTIKSYISHIKGFLSYIGNDKTEDMNNNIRKYMLFILDNEKLSSAYANQAISAIKFYCKYVSKQKCDIDTISRPRKENKLPEVLSFNEVYKILFSPKNEKHKTLLFLTYSAGLRVSEVVNLKVNDIDSERMLIHVVQGKGKKDRYTLLSKIALDQLRRYYMLYKPGIWLFPGEKQDSHITIRTAQRIFENACNNAKISKKVTIHSLRHSFATHMLENGIDLRYIQELLGHASTKTTEIYTHVTQKNISNIKSPLDLMS